jgi:hypothetical protein
MTQEYILDLDRLREEVTQNIISLFNAIDELVEPAQSKFDEFRPVIEGYNLSHDALLRALNIELINETEIPIIEHLEDIFEGWHEDNFGAERTWDEIRLLIKRLTTHGLAQ